MASCGYASLVGGICGASSFDTANVECVCVCVWGGGGGNTPVHMLFGDVPLFRVWFFDRPLINRVRNSMIFEDFL